MRSGKAGQALQMSLQTSSTLSGSVLVGHALPVLVQYAILACGRPFHWARQCRTVFQCYFLERMIEQPAEVMQQQFPWCCMHLEKVCSSL